MSTTLQRPRTAAEIADELEPVIREHEQAIEDDRTLPPPLVDALYAAGVFSTFVPAEVGGLQMDPLEWLDLVERLSAVNGSVGWLAMNNCGFGMNYMPPEVFRRVEGHAGRFVSAMNYGRWGGVARRVDGGYRISGRWPFVSGSPFATHVGGVSVLHDDAGEVVIHPDGLPWLISATWPVEQATLVDTWDGLGLRGTGSGDMEVVDLFVPTEMVNEAGFTGLTYDHPMFRIPLLPIAAHGAHAIGLGQAAIDEFVAMTRQKAVAGSMRQKFMGKGEHHQVTLGKAHALLGAARSYLHRTTADALANVADQRHLDLEHRVLMRQAMVFSTQAGKQVADMVFAMAGSGAVYRGRPLERIYRDVVTAANHIVVAEVEYASCGSYHLTRDLPEGPQTSGRKFV